MHNKWLALRNECVFLWSNSTSRFVFKMCFLLAILCLWGHAHATGTDIAEGAADDLQATEKGTGVKILYGVEFFICLVTVIVKRSLMSFIYIFAIALFVGYVGTKFLS